MKDYSANYSENCGYTLNTGDKILEQTVFIYPNPTNINLSIESKVLLNKVEIISITGVKIKKIYDKLNSINLSNLSKGVFLIRLYSKNGNTYKKIVKK